MSYNFCCVLLVKKLTAWNGKRTWFIAISLPKNGAPGCSLVPVFPSGNLLSSWLQRCIQQCYLPKKLDINSTWFKLSLSKITTPNPLCKSFCMSTIIVTVNSFARASCYTFNHSYQNCWIIKRKNEKKNVVFFFYQNNFTSKIRQF